MNDPKMIKFWLDGCDISFIAIAPANITLEQLLEQTDKIHPHWCACGIKTADINNIPEVEIGVGYIKKLDVDAEFDIIE